MVRVQVISLREDMDNLTKALLLSRSFQPEEPKVPISGERVEFARSRLASISEHLNKVNQIIELGGIPKIPKGKMEIKSWESAVEESEKEAKYLEEKFATALEEIGRVKAEILIIQQQMGEIEPFADININIEELEKTGYFDLILGYTDKEGTLLLSSANGVFSYYMKRNEDKYYLLIAAPKQSPDFRKILDSGKIRRLEIPENLPKVPYDAYRELQDRLNRLNTILESLKGKAAQEIRKEEERLVNLMGNLSTLRDALSLLSKGRVSKFFFQVEGYIPKKQVSRTEELLKKFTNNQVSFSTEYPKRYEHEEPPTQVTLPKPLKPLEAIVEIYGTPSYWEFAPTAFLIITFPIFFGLMFPDFGNALVLFIFSLLFRRYGIKRGSENIKNLSLVLIYSSIAAMITGLISRGFFGPLPVGGLREMGISSSPGPLNTIWPVPVSVERSIYFLLPFGEFAQPAVSVPDAIIISITIGTAVLFISSLIGLINGIKKRDKDYVLLEKLPLLVIYGAPFFIFTYGLTDPSNFFTLDERLLAGIQYSIFPFGSPPSTELLGQIIKFWVVGGLLYNWFARSIIGIKFEHASTGFGVVSGFIEGAFDGALLLLSNTISFIRILVLAMAHYYVLFAFSFMGYLAAGGPHSTISVLSNPLAIVIIIIGNLLAIGLEGLIVFVQDLRLHFYEMFSKFYEGKGKRFEPVRNYVEIN